MHFFIEHTVVHNNQQVRLSQSQGDMRFGPDPANPTTQFNITTQFQSIASRKAFACQRGMMFLQRDDNNSNLVNAIIKPIVPVKINGITVKYYIYRGLNYSDFFIADSGYFQNDDDRHYMIEASTVTSEFINSFWNAARKSHESEGNNDPLGRISARKVGYVHQLHVYEGSFLVENIFNSQDSVKSAFVEEGMWIGNFTVGSNIGFEIVVESDLKAVTLFDIRRNSIIDISSSSLSELKKRRIKELVLSYIDPAAFFGTHSDLGVNVSTYSGNIKSTVLIKGSDLYINLISLFTNKNKVYLDIRSERGMSYNFYNTYLDDNSRNFTINGTDELYGTDGWPIKIYNAAVGHSNNRNMITFRLRTNGSDQPQLTNEGNIQPVLYLENDKFSSPDTSNQFNFFRLSNNNGWITQQTLYYPNVVEGNIRSNIANYIRLYYYIGKLDDIDQEESRPRDNHRLWSNKCYDSAFCSIDLEGLGNINIQNQYVQSSNPLYIEEKMQTNGTGNFAFLAESGAYWDQERILFYTKALDKNAEKGSGKKYFRIRERNPLTINNRQFDTILKPDFDILCKRYDGINILGINYYKKGAGNNERVQEKEDLMLLGLTITELESIKYAVRNFSENHPKYIFLERDHTDHLTDAATGYRYYRYNVRIRGVNNAGECVFADQDPVWGSQFPATVVYSRDNIFFSSDLFSRNETLSEGHTTPGDNIIKYEIHHNNNIYINDNIDLALVRKSRMINEHQVEPEADHLNTTVQEIYYQYYGPDNAHPVDIAHFNIVMANKMIRRLGVTNIPDAYIENTDIIYTNRIDPSNAKRSFCHQETEDIIVTRNLSGRNQGTRYENLGKKIFMVHFVSELNNDGSDQRNQVFTSTNNNLGLIFSYYDTRRRFAHPHLAAIVFGAMIRTELAIDCTGFGFWDGTSYPSYNHVNGLGIDSKYFAQLPGTSGQWNLDIEWLRALNEYGITYFCIGNATRLPTFNPEARRVPLVNQARLGQDRDGATTHDNHLHSDILALYS